MDAIMRNGLCIALVLSVTAAGSASAQAPYPYGCPAVWYPAPYYGSYYPYYLPPSPVVLPPPELWGPPPAPARRQPKLLGWPPPRQLLPPCNPPPPDLLAGGEAAPLTDPPPGSPLTCEAPPPAPAPPPADPGEPQGYRFYGSVEFLYFWMKRGSVPPLVATGPLNGSGGAVLLDQTTFDDEERLGARATVGHWLDGAQRVGLEATWLHLFERRPSYLAESSGVLPLAVPFADPTGAERAIPIATPDLSVGRIEVEEVSRLWSGEINLRYGLGRSAWHHLDLLAGFRALDFEEGLTQTDTTTLLAGQAAGSSAAFSDRFASRNLFLGGQLGLDGEIHYGRWYADAWGKIGLGDNHEQVRIGGTTLLTGPAGSQTALPGGIFAQPSNIGHYSRDELTWLPEVGLQFGCQVAHHTRIYAGYDFLYLPSVARPGDQLDRTVAPGQALSGASANRPAFAFQNSDAWVQGVTMGLEFRY
jgi:hypothetical protein